jgi:HEAT repeat protein
MKRFDERDRESVLRDLESMDEEVRRLAVERVEALSAHDVVPILVDRIGDHSWRVRKSAVERLVAWPDTDAAASALIAALGDGENPGRRNAAVEALIHHGVSVVPHLIAAVEDEDTGVRKFTIDAMAGIGDDRTVQALVAHLEDPDVNVCAAAADALGAVGGDDAVRALCAAATSESHDPLVRFSALHALAALEAPIRARDLGGVLADPVLCAGGLALLGCVDDDPEALDALLKGLSAHSRACREAAQRSLLRLLSRVDDSAANRVVERIRAAAEGSPEIVSSTIERLEEADLATKLALVQFLGLLRDQRSVVPILLSGRDEALSEVSLAALESMGEVVEEVIDAAWAGLGADARRDACRLFGKTCGGRSAARLVASLEDHDAAIRTAAARSLGRRAIGEALAPLIHRLEESALDDDLEGEEECAAVTDALAAIASASDEENAGPALAERAVEMLNALLRGAADNVRLAIASVLGRVGRPGDLEIVTLLLKAASAEVRRAAVQALSRLDDGTMAEPLHLAIADESPDVRIAAAIALGASCRSELFADLHCLTSDEDARVRATAVQILGQCFLEDGDPERRAAAMAVMHLARDDEAPVALAVVEAARTVGASAASHVVPLLRRREPEVVREAVRYLGAHADGTDLDVVIPMLAHPDWSVRAEATQVLADRTARKAVPAILRSLELEQDEYVRSVALRALDRLEG